MERVAATQHLGRARELYAIKKYDLAIASALDAIAADEGDAAAFVLLANCYERSGRLPEASAAAKRAIELDPERSPAHVAFGMVLFAQRKYVEAVGRFREAIRLAPEYGDAHRMLAHALLMRRSFAEGLAAIDRALELQPQAVHSHEVRILLLSAAGRPVAAEAAVAALLSIDPENALALRQKGMLRVALGGPRDAMTPLREALRVDPNAAIGRSVYARGVIGTSWARHLPGYALAVFFVIAATYAVSGHHLDFPTTVLLYLSVLVVRRTITVEVLRRDAISRTFLRPSELAFNRLSAALAIAAIVTTVAAAYQHAEALAVFGAGALATAVAARVGRTSPPAARDAPHRIVTALFAVLTAGGAFAAAFAPPPERADLTFAMLFAIAGAVIVAILALWATDRAAFISLLRALIPGRRASPLT